MTTPGTDEQVLVAQAMTWAKANRKRIARRLADTANFPPEAQPVSVFIRTASSGENKRVCKQVLERATARQIRVLNQVEARKS